MKKWLYLFFIFPMALMGQYNYQNLFFTAQDELFILNFENDTPELSQIVIDSDFFPNFHLITHIEDSAANILSYSDGGSFYDTNHNLILGSWYDYSPSTEISACKLPGEENKYYYFYNTGTWGNFILYNIVDFNLNNGLGEALGDYYLTSNNFNYSEGLELIHIPNTDNYWLILMELNTGKLVRYKIDETGIGPKETAFEIGDYSIGLQMQGEIDYHNGKLVYIGCKWNEPYGDEVFVFDFDPNNGEASNMNVFDINKAFGGEFSPDGSKLYISSQYENWNNLHQINLINNTVSTSSIPTTGAGLKSIEMGPDAKLYISTFTTKIHVIDNPNDSDFSTSFIDGGSNLRGGISDLVQSFEYPSLNLNASINHPSCYELNDGTATIFVLNGTPPFTYQWDDPQNQTTATATNLFAGSYSVIVTDSTGLQNSFQVTLQSPNSIQANESITNALCFESQDGAIQLNITGGTPPYDIWWFGEDSANLAPGEYNYLIVDSLNCSLLDTFIIQSPGDIQLTANIQNVSCQNAIDGSIEISCSGGTEPYNFEWSGGNNFQSSSQNISALNPGTYYLSLTDAIGCTSASSYSVNIDNFLSIDTLITTPNPCEKGGSASVQILNGTPPFQYSWFLENQIIGTDSEINNLDAGLYSLSVIDQNNCIVEIQNILIDTTGAPICDFIPDNNSVYTLNDSVYFIDLSVSENTGAINNWFWDFDDGGTSNLQNPIHQYIQQGQYYVSLKIIDEYDCECEIAKYISIIDDHFCFIPNSFSPNNDNMNEVFHPIISDLDEDSYQLTIFDRWGKAIFLTNEYSESWDGRSPNSAKKIAGSYTYKVEYKTNSKKQYSTTGFINLIL